MAKIKTLKYTIDDQEVKVDIHCSSKGVFSSAISQYWRQILNIENKNGNSLAEIETEINLAVNEYINSKALLKLKIGITFGASGKFMKDLKGGFLPIFQNYKSPYFIDTLGLEMTSLLGIDYRVIIEEHRNGITNYYQAVPIEKLQQSEIYPWNKCIGGYVDEKLIYRLNKSEKLIDFSETALQNLNNISEQLQKASTFLGELMSSNQLGLVLNSPNIKLLKNSNL